MRWSETTSPQLGRADLPERVGLVPVGATEQHGPHLPTDTDTRIALAWSEAAVAQRDAQAIVLPAITVGCSLGHGTTFPGTLSLFPGELTRLLIRYAEWAATSGLTRLLYVNGHMGNVNSIAAAVDTLRFRRPDIQSGWINWWDADPAIAAIVSQDGEDIHANLAETSIMLHLNPELVDTEAMRTADDADRTSGLSFRYTAASLSTNGVTGRPSAATQALGSELFQLMLKAIDGRIESGLRECAPLPAGPTAPALSWI